jgi:isopentenyl-diphosphate delta-isomerase
LSAVGHVGAAKDLHIEACLGDGVECGPKGPTNGLERYRLRADLPEFSLEEIDTTAQFLGKKFSLPLFISALTGGGRTSGRINRHLAEAAQTLGIAMSVGSQRLMLEHSETAASYRVRRWAPDVLLFANLGLVHLNYGLTEDRCRRAVEEIGADALVFYVNPMHEALQRSGSSDFRGLPGKLDRLCRTFPVPVLVKEVGFGFPEPALRRLAEIDLAAVDVAGKGGTDWARVERAMGRSRPVEVYGELGTPTAEALETALRVLPKTTAVLASGGIRTGVEIAKVLAMGARLAGMALPFLRWAHESSEKVVEEVRRIEEELRISLWYAGARDLAGLLGKVERRPLPPLAGMG